MRPRGPRTDCQSGSDPQTNYPLLSFSRLQGLAMRFTGQDPGTALVLFPLSANTARRDNQNLPVLTLPAPRFSQPLSRSPIVAIQLVGLFHPTGTRRVTAFRA